MLSTCIRSAKRTTLHQEAPCWSISHLLLLSRFELQPLREQLHVHSLFGEELLSLCIAFLLQVQNNTADVAGHARQVEATQKRLRAGPRCQRLTRVLRTSSDLVASKVVSGWLVLQKRRVRRSVNISVNRIRGVTKRPWPAPKGSLTRGQPLPRPSYRCASP